jgi:predicted GTPase
MRESDLRILMLDLASVSDDFCTLIQSSCVDFAELISSSVIVVNKADLVKGEAEVRLKEIKRNLRQLGYDLEKSLGIYLISIIQKKGINEFLESFQSIIKAK